MSDNLKQFGGPLRWTSGSFGTCGVAIHEGEGLRPVVAPAQSTSTAAANQAADYLETLKVI